MKRKKPVSEYHARVGSLLRIARMECGMSQEHLAKALGVTFQQVQKYEKGINRISTEYLAIAAARLGKPLSFFLGADAEGTPDTGILGRMLLTGARGIALAEYFVGMPAALQIKVVDLVRDIAELRIEAAQTLPVSEAAE